MRPTHSGRLRGSVPCSLDPAIWPASLLLILVVLQQRQAFQSRLVHNDDGVEQICWAATNRALSEAVLPRTSET